MSCRTDKILRRQALFLIYRSRSVSHGSPRCKPHLLSYNIHTVLLHWHSHNIRGTLETKSEYPLFGVKIEYIFLKSNYSY